MITIVSKSSYKLALAAAQTVNNATKENCLQSTIMCTIQCFFFLLMPCPLVLANKYVSQYLFCRYLVVMGK